MKTNSKNKHIKAWVPFKVQLRHVDGNVECNFCIFSLFMIAYLSPGQLYDFESVWEPETNEALICNNCPIALAPLENFVQLTNHHSIYLLGTVTLSPYALYAESGVISTTSNNRCGKLTVFPLAWSSWVCVRSL